jgi:hypothetical protein
MNNKNRVWVIPANDLESMRIGEILKLHNEAFYTTTQKWGASWCNIEEEIRDTLTAVPRGTVVYGIELIGVANIPGCTVVNIDHHRYNGDDRSNPKSSLEQVIDIVGCEITVWDRAVAANDVGYIPAIQELCETLNMPAAATAALVDTVRRKDREAQGVTSKEEQLAAEDMEHIVPDSTMVVGCSLNKCSPYTDHLFGQYETLVLISREGEVNVFAPAEIINSLIELDIPNSWSGGGSDSGFWGCGCTEYNRIPEILEAVYRDLVFID